MSHISIIFHRVGPYHDARLRASAKLLPLRGIQGCQRDQTYQWEELHHDASYPLDTLFDGGDSVNQPPSVVFQRLAEVLDGVTPCVVIVPGWSDTLALAALKWCLINQVPAVVMSESTVWDEPRVAWKEWIKRRIVGLASTALVGGQPHADYIQQLGLPKDRVSLGYDAVDNAYFAAEAAKYRSPLAVDCCPSYFLASNRFIEKKNLFRLLDAYAGYLKSFQLSAVGGQYEETDSPLRHLGAHQALDGPAGHSAHAPRTTDNRQQTTLPLPWDLCMLGDGELKPRLLAHCAKLGLHVIEAGSWDGSKKARSEEPNSFPIIDLRPSSSGTVFFPGFRQIDELPKFYAHAGAFVHASTTEQWGLVVNEAMACGLPVLVSNRVGCAQDLVQNDVNGFTFDPYDVEQLTQLMIKVSASDFPLSAFGDASRAIISDWSPERFATGLKRAVDCAVQVGAKRASLLQRVILKVLLWR
jgi:glycosyltransferase involved in cell wall biosynthesis